jgi:surface antigen
MDWLRLGRKANTSLSLWFLVRYITIERYIASAQLPKRIDGTLPKTRRTTSLEKNDYSFLLSAPREALETRPLSQSFQWLGDRVVAPSLKHAHQIE